MSPIPNLSLLLGCVEVAETSGGGGKPYSFPETPFALVICPTLNPSL